MAFARREIIKQNKLIMIAATELWNLKQKVAIIL